MDQTSFCLLVGLFIGLPVGAVVLQSLTGWSLWITFLTGGIVGLFVMTAVTYMLIEYLGRSVMK
jgi:hypothetical protein